MATSKEENWVPKNLADFRFKARENQGFDSAKYEAKNHSYPDDLMSNPQYGGNYAIFYINVAVDSKLLTDPKVQTVSDILPRDRGDLIAQNFSKTGIGAAAGGAAGLAAGGGIGALVGGGSGAVKGLAVGGLAGAGAGALLTSDYGIGSLAASATRAQKRLKTAIALHIPNNLTVRYGVNYESEDTAGVAMMGAGADEIAKAMSSQGKMSDLSDPAKAMVANIALSKAPNAGAVSAAMGLAANPKKEQVFKGVDFRTFQFEYQFFPRNSKEAKNVLNIVHEFKYHMHPEFKDSNNFIYIYPSEFDIFYYAGGKENTNIHRHTSCVLTEMNINYTPNGQFTTFADGMPTQINIQMSFRELALLTKDKIKGGL
jgi:uncharacterized protein YcfJ